MTYQKSLRKYIYQPLYQVYLPNATLEPFWQSKWHRLNKILAYDMVECFPAEISYRTMDTHGHTMMAMVSNNTHVGCIYVVSSVGTKGPKVCQENIPHTITPPLSALAYLLQGSHGLLHTLVVTKGYLSYCLLPIRLKQSLLFFPYLTSGINKTCSPRELLLPGFRLTQQISSF